MLRTTLLLSLFALSSRATIINSSFESALGPGNWTESDSVFPSIQCSVALCGNGAGTAGPRTGSFWMWFGGDVATQLSFVQQSVVIPVGALSVDFYFYMVPFTGNLTFSFKVDGTELFAVSQLDAAAYQAYTLVSVNVSAYADGNAHMLRFDYSDAFDVEGSNLHLDDVTLRMGGGGSPVPEPATTGLVGLALGALGWAGRMKNKKGAQPKPRPIHP